MPHTKFLKAFLLTVAVSAVGAAPASAGGNLFLQDSNFVSDSNLPTYVATGTGTIAISSLNLGVATGGSGRAFPGVVTVTKAVDLNTPFVLGKMVSGKDIGQVKIRAYRSTGNSAANYLTYCFNTAFVTSSQQQVKDDDSQPQETLSFSYQKMTIGTTQMKSTGLTPFTRGAWDVTANMFSSPTAATECA